jgi:TPR repeat protein
MEQALAQDWTAADVNSYFGSQGMADTTKLRAEHVTGPASMGEDGLKAVEVSTEMRRMRESNDMSTSASASPSAVRGENEPRVSALSRPASPPRLRPPSYAAPSPGTPKRGSSANGSPRMPTKVAPSSPGARQAGDGSPKPTQPAVRPGGASRNNWPVYEGLVLDEFVVTSGQADVYRGTFSSVLRLPVAAKVLFLKNGSEKAFVSEVTALRNLKHPNILAMEAFFEKPQFCIVTRWMGKGSLNKLLERERKTVPWEPRGRKFALHIASGLAYLHSHKVVHRDLKSLNVLVGGDDVAVLADFGFAKTSVSSSVQVATAQVGTVHWMAPEMIEHGTYTAASDVYAFGIILWELCACKLPYETFQIRRQVENAVVRGERPPVDSKWQAEAREMMTRCWSFDFTVRPSAADLVQEFEGSGAGARSTTLSKPYTHELEQAKKLRAEGRIVEARKLLQAAVDGGSVEAMFELGAGLEFGGWGINIDLRRASEMMWLASEAGYGPAMARLARMYKDGTGVAHDNKKAEELGVKALQTEDAYACGLCYDFGLGVSKDVTMAAEWYTRAAEQGNIFAQKSLGACYRNGEGAVKDEKKGVEWFTRAAKQGYANAQCNLGLCYVNGQGVAKDEKKAVDWYTKASEQGCASAHSSLGVCYLNGQGVAKDEKKAVELFTRAAEQGIRGAQCNLGCCYLNGEGVVKNEKKAVEWFTRAAEQGLANAQDFLAVCFQCGRGVAKDEKKGIGMVFESCGAR